MSKRRIRRFRVQVLLGDGRKVTIKDNEVLDLAALLDQTNRMRRTEGLAAQVLGVSKTSEPEGPDATET